MLDLDRPEYTLAQAAAAARFNLNTLRSLYADKRRIFEFMDNDRAASAKGSAIKLSLRSVMTVAVAAQLISVGVPAKSAFLAGLKFTDFGSAAGENSEGVGRQPAGLYDLSKYRTILVWQPSGPSTRILPIPLGTRFDLDELLENPMASVREPAAVVEINDVVSFVLATLPTPTPSGPVSPVAQEAAAQ